LDRPSSKSQVKSAPGRYEYSTGTSNYVNPCLLSVSVTVPTKFRGIEPAAHGMAYAGGYFFGTSYEYMARDITPLQVGQPYEVSMSVSLADASGLGTDDIGVYFFLNGPTTVSTTTVLPVVPQIDYTSFGPITI